MFSQQCLVLNKFVIKCAAKILKFHLQNYFWIGIFYGEIETKGIHYFLRNNLKLWIF